MKVVALTNVRGTREIMRLAKSCKELRSIVHVSTAYCHATKSRVGQAVKEQFYDSPVPPNAFIDMAENIDENKLENMMQMVKADWPNSYSFSKALGEEIVRSEAGNLPISIVRPAIVISSYREPLPGWIDPMNSLGPSGLILGLVTGIIHVLRTRQDIVLSLVPADLVTNTTLVAAWETTKAQSNEGNIKIYNITNNRNPLLWAEIGVILETFGRKLISSRAVWYCFLVQTTHKFLFTILFWLLHYIPAFIADTACRFTNRRPM
ncbi:fatty acyl-CoA reductase wat-like [Papilio machaon]|uniref:fatty acyl-CoA reductase wat-like n=1 Tax=Papilio machaon TaxID=76193 RepID=UPI001E662FDB|nr:fatty acyl-CoA reductase wat-like [Papilio machaon]